MFKAESGQFYDFSTKVGGYPQQFVQQQGMDVDAAWKAIAEFAGVEPVDRCRFCDAAIEWREKTPYNPDGSPHSTTCTNAPPGRRARARQAAASRITGETIFEVGRFRVTTDGVFRAEHEPPAQQSEETELQEADYRLICCDPVIIKDRAQIFGEDESAYVTLVLGKEEKIVPMSCLLAKNIDKLADRGMRTFTAEHAKQISEYFELAIRNVPFRTVYKRLGWCGERFIISGLCDEREILPDSHLNYKVEAGDAEKGMRALKALVQVTVGYTFLPLLLFSLLASAAKRLELQRFKFAMFLIGGTGNYKTTLAKYALAIYGRKIIDEYLRFGEGATSAGFIKCCSIAHDLPLLIDNYKPNVGNGEPQLVNLITSIIEGKEKQRLDQKGNFRPAPALGAWPVITGETGIETDTSTIARSAEFEFKRGEKALEHLEIARINESHLPAVGKAWLEWLTSEAGRQAMTETKKDWPTINDKWNREASKQGVQNPTRVAANLTCIELMYELVGKCSFFAWLTDYGHDLHNCLQQSLAQMSRSTTDAREGVRFLSALTELIASNKVVLGDNESVGADGGNKTFIGWDAEKNNAVYLIPQIALLEAKKLNNIKITNKSLYLQLEDLDALAEKGDDQTTVLKNVGRKRQRVLAIKRSKLFVDATEETVKD